MKLGHLKAVESVMSKLIQSELPIKMAFGLNLIVEEMEEKLVKLEEFRISLVEKHGEKDDKGNIQVPNDKMEIFNEEYTELLDSDIDLVPVILDANVLESLNFKVTVRELNALVKAGFLDMKK